MADDEMIGGDVREGSSGEIVEMDANPNVTGAWAPSGPTRYQLNDTRAHLYVNVNRATNMQVQGHMTVYMDGNSGKKKRVKARKPLTKSTAPVTQNQVLNIKDRLGRDWKDLGRRFGYDDGHLEQLHMQHTHDFCELNYQLLLKWQRDKGDDANMANLAKIFKDMQRGDLADLLAE